MILFIVFFCEIDLRLDIVTVRCKLLYFIYHKQSVVFPLFLCQVVRTMISI